MAQKGAPEDAGKAEEHIITESATKEMKLGGVESGESWLWDWRWRRGVRRRRTRKTNDEAGLF